jgi:predicted nucleic-acid-binding Zn-ribbon protein
MYSARSSLNVSTPSFINRKSTNENPASNSSTRESSASRLMIASVEKYQRKYATFTDDEKIGIVEAFVDCENLSEKRIALTHLKEIMSVKDSRYLTIDLEKLRRWTEWYESVKNGKVDLKRGLSCEWSIESTYSS